MKYICWETFSKTFCEMGIVASKRRNFFLELWKIFENLVKLWMFVDETHIIRSCYAAGWQKHQCQRSESEEHLLIYQGRQLCDDK